MHTDNPLYAVQPVTTDDNPFKLVARYKKARKIADHLLSLGVTDVTPEPTEEMLELAGLASETNKPSLTTWALVAHLVKEAA